MHAAENKEHYIVGPKKTNETNSFKVKTWEWFDLTILKIKQMDYRESKFY